jgi:hypothetical protein
VIGRRPAPTTSGIDTDCPGRVAALLPLLGRLPSIAVFVDGDDLIDPLIDATRPLLEARNIPIVGCKEGRVVGDDQEVRVYDVQHIKGLEFEAVFFIGIDRLADRIPDLFQRLLYVGVTRAATYLGLTCERELPARRAPEGRRPDSNLPRTDSKSVRSFTILKTQALTSAIRIRYIMEYYYLQLDQIFRRTSCHGSSFGLGTRH